jgi:energy-coupling factor transporter ATP-binding protein EcfA2
LKIVRALANSGVTIIFISHRLAEVEQVADKITVLRDGRTVGTSERGKMDRAGIVRLMLGEELRPTDVGPRRARDRVALSVRHLCRRREAGCERTKNGIGQVPRLDPMMHLPLGGDRLAFRRVDCLRFRGHNFLKKRLKHIASWRSLASSLFGLLCSNSPEFTCMFVRLRKMKTTYVHLTFVLWRI